MQWWNQQLLKKKEIMGDNETVLLSDYIRASGPNDLNYTTRINTIEQGFSSKRFFRDF